LLENIVTMNPSRIIICAVIMLLFSNSSGKIRDIYITPV